MDSLERTSNNKIECYILKDINISHIDLNTNPDTYVK